MAETKTNHPPKKRRSWLRILLSVFLVLIALLVVAFFVVSSSGFFKSVVLPRAGKALNSEITVSDASIRPFSRIVLRDLKITPHGRETLATVQEVRARYHLFDILRGNLHVEEVALVSPVIHVVERADGTSNLDPILESQTEDRSAAKKDEPSEPAQLNIRSITLTGATFRQEKIHAGGTRDLAELSDLNLSLTNLQNGQTGKATLAAALKMQTHPPAPAEAGLLQGAARGEYQFTLSASLKPVSVQGQSLFNVTRAEGALADLSEFGAVLNADITPQEIKQVALQFRRGETSLGELRASGPFDMEKTEGRLAIVLLSIDKRLLNLAGAASGLDFGTTAISATNEVVFANAGSVISATGRFSADKFQVTRTNQTTPTLDLHAHYDVTLNNAQSNAQLRALTLNGTQNGRPLLRGELTSPMTLAWGNTADAVGDSSLNLTVTNFNLADWQPFLGDIAPAGSANLAARLTSQQGGQRLMFDVNSTIANLTVRLDTNEISQVTARLLARGEAADLKQFNLAEYRLELARQNQNALTAFGSGTYDTETESADLQLTLQATLARLLQLLNQPDIAAASGSAELKARVTQKQNTQTVVGNLTLQDFTGRVGGNQFNRFGAVADLDLRQTPEQLEIRKAAGRVTQGENAGGTFDVSGTYGFDEKPTQLNVKLTDFNQNGLRPFIEPLLAEQQLVSISVNGDASARLNPNGDSSVKANFQVANLVVRDPKQPAPGSPLEARLMVDTEVKSNVADLRDFQITLTPTQRGKNELRLQGKVDYSNSEAISGNLKLAAESLDLTRYYDLFAEKKPAETPPGGSPAPASSPAPAQPQPEQEPEAVNLPFRNFVVEASVRELHLRELAVTNWQTTVKLDGGRVLLNPFQLALNGSPVTATADLDLSIPGYKYALTFHANRVPFAPLWNTFNPEEKGQVGGTLSAQADIRGVGTTGASLRNTLAGNFDVGTTNLNLDVAKIKSPMLRTLVRVVASLPQLAQAQNAQGALSALAGGLTGNALSGRGGLENDLAQSPIDVITARGVAGSGRIELQQAIVRSTVFEADARGTITLAPVLTNSTIDIPVSISLNRAIAERIRLASANTPANGNYVKLPDFFSETGTIGNPKPNINYLALGRSALGIAGGVAGTNTDAGRILNTLGNVLNRPAVGTNTTTNTNQPAATNQSPVNNLLNDILRPRR